MKKSLFVTLAFVLVVGFQGLAAAENDVSVNHWAYDAVKKLASDGMIDRDAYSQITGDKTLTRYEFAVAVAKAVEKEDKATDEQKALIDKLANEYRAELEALGVRVRSLEDKADIIQFAGTYRVRYDESNGTTYDDFHFNINFALTYRINHDGWLVTTEGEWQKQFDRPGDGNSAGMNALSDKASWGQNQNEAVNSQMEQLYVAGPISGASVKAGKYDFKPVYGLSFDTKVTGGEITFGKTVKTTVTSGKTDDDYQVNAVELNWAASQKSNIKAGYQRTELDGVNKNYTSIGFDAEIANDLHWIAAATKSNQTSNNKACFTQLQYKSANAEVVGSNDVFASYRKVPADAVFYTSQDLEDRILDIDFKGIRVGFDYVPMKDSKFTVWFMDGKDATTCLNDIRVYRGQIELYF
ncbi:MAG: S-layer protein [Firmicutes bacterium]|nr:S-layer protein [Bacillota bacterium]